MTALQTCALSMGIVLECYQSLYRVTWLLLLLLLVVLASPFMGQARLMQN